MNGDADGFIRSCYLHCSKFALYKDNCEDVMENPQLLLQLRGRGMTSHRL